MSDGVEQLLGRIDGKLDQVIASFKEHREDDTRRFAEVNDRLEDHAKDINKAKGAKAAVFAAAAAISGVVGIGIALAKDILK